MTDQNVRHYLNKMIADGLEFQVGLKGLGNPLGPAKCERFEVDRIIDGTVQGKATLYRMLLKVTLPPAPNAKFARATQLTQPIVFDAADVLIVIEAPINDDGEKAIIQNGGRTPGGLHIPGA